MEDRVITADAEVGAIAFLADGKTLAGVCRDGKLRLWDARSGALKRSLAWNGAGTKDALVTLSPAAGVLATVGKRRKHSDLGSSIGPARALDRRIRPEGPPPGVLRRPQPDALEHAPAGKRQRGHVASLGRRRQGALRRPGRYWRDFGDGYLTRRRFSGRRQLRHQREGVERPRR